MKKIITLLFSLIIFGSVCSQERDIDNMEVHVSTHMAQSFYELVDEPVNMFDACVGLKYIRMFNDDMFMTVRWGLLYTAYPVREYRTAWGIGFGGYIYKNLYGMVDFYPHAYVRGVGHQVYGDYLTVNGNFRFGCGDEFYLTKHSKLFIEIYFEHYLTIYTKLDSENISNSFFGISFGYSYRIN